MEDPHHVLLSADEVPGACVHVRVRCSWCHVLLGQEVNRKQKTAPRPGRKLGVGATCVGFILVFSKDSWVRLVAI